MVTLCDRCERSVTIRTGKTGSRVFLDSRADKQSAYHPLQRFRVDIGRVGLTNSVDAAVRNTSSTLKRTDGGLQIDQKVGFTFVRARSLNANFLRITFKSHSDTALTGFAKDESLNFLLRRTLSFPFFGGRHFRFASIRSRSEVLRINSSVFLGSALSCLGATNVSILFDFKIEVVLKIRYTGRDLTTTAPSMLPIGVRRKINLIVRDLRSYGMDVSPRHSYTHTVSHSAEDSNSVMVV